MQIPNTLTVLIDEGILEGVVRPLMSGKEAQVYLVRSGGELRVAKVYKQAQNRSFRQRSEYTEGRTVRNSRDQRAMDKRTRHGREQDEAAWRSAEVDVIHRLHAAGVRVPTPYQFVDGVLIMELITDAAGNPAPRLGDVSLDAESAGQIYQQLLREVIRMLCAGVVHGDLSDFNVLLGPDGPVIIDFPQAVDASKNQNARRLLLRDVDNLHRFHAGFAPESRSAPYAEEIWQLYERGELTPDVRLRGRYRRAEGAVDTASVLGLIADAEKDERKRRVNQGIGLRGIAQPATSETRTQLPPQRRREEPVRSSELQAKHPKARTDTTSVSHQPPPPRSQSNQAAAPARDAPRASTELPQTNGSGVPSKASKRRRRRRRSQRTDAATTNANHPAPAQPSTRPRWQA